MSSKSNQSSKDDKYSDDKNGNGSKPTTTTSSSSSLASSLVSSSMFKSSTSRPLYQPGYSFGMATTKDKTTLRWGERSSMDSYPKSIEITKNECVYQNGKDKIVYKKV